MESIKCKYKFEKNYNPQYANGAFGGINTLGEIIIHFYLERNALPISHTLGISNGMPNANILNSEPDDLNGSFIRYIQNGVVLNYESAKEFHRWLGEHLKALESIKKPQSNEIE